MAKFTVKDLQEALKNLDKNKEIMVLNSYSANDKIEVEYIKELSTVIVSIMIAMPPRAFMALMDTAKSISKAKFIEVMKEVLKEKVKNGADNDINN